MRCGRLHKELIVLRCRIHTLIWSLQEIGVRPS